MTPEEKKKLRIFEKGLGYTFKKGNLLCRALTHKSFINERNLPSIHHNERLEFLGDAVLELAISEFIMERFPQSPEGELSKLRASIVNEGSLAELARQYNFGPNLYLGRGEDQTNGREKNSLLANAYEAVLGAVYLDRGFKKALCLVKKHYARLLDSTPMQSFYRDFKTELQEKSQALFRTIPRYRLVKELGPDHEKVFEVEILIRNKIYGQGRGKSKKEAEQMAAEKTLIQIVHLNANDL